MSAAVVSESRYKSFLKPAKFWQKSNKTAPAGYENDENKPLEKTPTTLFKKKTDDEVALRETAKGEIYKLSTVSDSGVYLPPSPTEDSKRDHWLNIDQEAMVFPLPDFDRLTTNSGEKHSFYTPSVIVDHHEDLVSRTPCSTKASSDHIILHEPL
ncbi:uncharacterized protein BYT42DRAFT_491031 [Radiomyces spectabilis]|uniref:uncharacterized protein n=1 Tax=Radiomyces spectabilis TaxID=64574 RepID=UPI00221F9143|nr:uncharacterized protein BYT42DRAFT_491031 [Radiomyces spectabilis]KAI8388251.1 hypothetical protein BYT42DRAFT_491031 [Radiomyces spectabilis]